MWKLFILMVICSSMNKCNTADSYVIMTPVINCFENQVQFRRNKRYALKPGAREQIEGIKQEYARICNSTSIDETHEEVEERREFCQLIIECAQALDDIERDLKDFAVIESEPNDSDPQQESLRETASIFSREFEECKSQIEEQLNKLL